MQLSYHVLHNSFKKNYSLEVKFKNCYKVFVYLKNLEVKGFCFCS
jgi:hypothetical protein